MARGSGPGVGPGDLAWVGTVKSAVHQPLPVPSLDLTPARHAARSVVMVTSPGSEPSRATVAVNLATVCAEIGQRVVVVTTEGLDVHLNGLEPQVVPGLSPTRSATAASTGH